ncbi:MAG TPA: cupin domain-containing protein [Spirochaetota bacterium]|nr:cupin domain-containing protein [Spirochaetota bacterium]
MIIARKVNSPRYERDGIESHLLVSEPTCGSIGLTVTLVEMGAGGFQHIHRHDNEQAYYILEGSGEMTVDDETRPVAGGDCVFIPSRSAHGLKNTGGTALRYLSACSPSFTKEECARMWPL